METSIDIEREVQARVDFKMNELLTAMRNVAKMHWVTAFQTMQVKHQHYWEAFEQMEEMFRKEVRMAPPHDQMDNHKRWLAKERAVRNIVNSLGMKGRTDYSEKVKALVREIEEAQNYDKRKR